MQKFNLSLVITTLGGCTHGATDAIAVLRTSVRGSYEAYGSEWGSWYSENFTSDSSCHSDPVPSFGQSLNLVIHYLVHILQMAALRLRCTVLNIKCLISSVLLIIFSTDPVKMSNGSGWNDTFFHPWRWRPRVHFSVQILRSTSRQHRLCYTSTVHIVLTILWFKQMPCTHAYLLAIKGLPNSATGGLRVRDSLKEFRFC